MVKFKYPAEMQKMISRIKEQAGYRELNILKNLSSVKVIQNDNNYKVYRFFAKDNEQTYIYFDYEAKSNRITG